MKMSNGKYNLRPLPGVRRGAPGAGAGCGRIRTTGGGELSRRAPAGNELEDTTADNHNHTNSSNMSPSSSNSSLFQSSPSTLSFQNTSNLSSSSSSLADVVQEAEATDPVPTASLNRARKKWSKEMNEFIWRTYLIITHNENNMKSYLKPLHQEFTRQFPEMNVSQQRLGDQIRAIVRNKLIASNQLAVIRSEVIAHLELNPHTNNHTQTSNSNPGSRMKWTQEINETLMQCYYDITDGETNMTAYRQKLYKKFISCYPSLSHLSEQRIADQRRAIVKNKFICENRLQQIQKDVLIQKQNTSTPIINDNMSVRLGGLGLHISQLHTHNPINLINNHNTHTLNTSYAESHTHTLNHDQYIQPPDTLTETSFETFTQEGISQIQHNSSQREIIGTRSRNDSTELKNHIDEERIQHEFKKALEIFKESNPTGRPYIPKERSSRNVALIIDYINKNVIPEHLTADQDFITLQTIIYCAAFTTATCNGCKIYMEGTYKRKTQEKPRWQRRIEQKIEKLRGDIGRLTQW